MFNDGKENGNGLREGFGTVDGIVLRWLSGRCIF